MTRCPVLQWDGPGGPAPTVLLAHGAGAGSSSPHLCALAAGLAARGLRVGRFDFDYMAARASGGRRLPDPTPRLLACFRAAVAATAVPPASLVLAGKSMGGRMATLLADELGARGVLVFGYPFHPPRRKDQWRTSHLVSLGTPCLILQGERDPFGCRDEVAALQLSPAIELVWCTDGDHDLLPRRGGAVARSMQFAAVLDRAAAFVQGLPRHGSGPS